MFLTLRLHGVAFHYNMSFLALLSLKAVYYELSKHVHSNNIVITLCAEDNTDKERAALAAILIMQNHLTNSLNNVMRSR